MGSLDLAGIGQGSQEDTGQCAGTGPHLDKRKEEDKEKAAQSHRISLAMEPLREGI